MTDREPQADWEAQLNLSPDSTQVSITCTKAERDQWSAEAEANGFRSRSQYLHTLIQEARGYRQHGVFDATDADDRIDQLEAQVALLEQQLERERQKHSGREHVDDPEFLVRFLEETYTPFEELLQRIVESGALTGLIKNRVEDQLYILAAQDRVEYQPGFGWRLTAPETESSSDMGGDR